MYQQNCLKPTAQFMTNCILRMQVANCCLDWYGALSQDTLTREGYMSSSQKVTKLVRSKLMLDNLGHLYATG
jgi:hypothetical protein